MEYAKSLVDGKLYLASKVSYGQTNKLKLVCPECLQKVFKSKRLVPNESHFFCHHSGVGIGCELYRQGTGSLNGPLNPFGFDSKGQLYKVFIQNVERDIQSCMYKSRTLEGKFNIIKFNKCRIAAKVAILDHPKFNSISNISIMLKSILHNKPQDLVSHSNMIADFYKKEQSRFIDNIVLSWISYYFYNDLPNSDIKLLTKIIVKHKDLFDNFCCIFIVGLSNYYLNKPLQSFKVEFLNNITSIGRIFQHEVSKKDEVKSYFDQHGVLPDWETRVSDHLKKPEDIVSKITNKAWILSNDYLINESAELKISKENYKYIDGSVSGFEIAGHGNLSWIHARDVIKRD